MLYHLFDWYQELPLSRLMHYVSFRSSVAFILSLIFTTIIGRRIIDRLRQAQIGETVRDLGLEGQMQKKGTPTMGGIIIILAILLPTLLLANLSNIYIVVMLITTILMGLVGFLDDYIKVFKKNKEGLHGRYKIIGQVSLGLLVTFLFMMSPQTGIRENNEIVGKEGAVETVDFGTQEVKSTKTTIPFVKNNDLNYSNILPVPKTMKEVAGWALFVIIAVLIITFISNCVNLTDGLDGLAAGSSAPVGVVLGILAYVSSHAKLAAYLNIMLIPGAEEMVIFAAAFVGATLGFLWFNSFPAQVFMGDTGSLTLGGIIAVFAILIRKELLLPILCGVFIVEGLSVMLQVAYFKYTKKRTGTGRRIFKMTPLHHHFQKPGDGSIDALWQKPFRVIPESKVTVRFWLIALVLAAVTVVTLKMR